MQRKTFGWLAVALLVALAVSAAGCGDDDGGADVVTTPSGTKVTPTPPPESSPAEGQDAPAPPPPELDEAAQRLAEGTVSAPIDPGLPYPLNPLGLPLEGGAQQPPCEEFVFAFGWQVTDPYPADGVDIYFQIVRDDGPVKVGEGPSGTAQTGCEPLQIVNAGQDFVILDLHYIIGGVVQP